MPLPPPCHLPGIPQPLGPTESRNFHPLELGSNTFAMKPSLTLTGIYEDHRE